MGSLYKRHVAILTFPFASHPGVLFTLARALVAASPSNVAFSFFTSAKTAAPLSRFVSDNLRIFEISDGCPEGHVLSKDNPVEGVMMYIRETPGNFKDGIRAAVEARGGARITCLISDAFVECGGEIAAELGVPWLAFSGFYPCSLSAHLYTDLLRRTLGVDDQGSCEAKADEDLGFIPGLSGFRVRDLPTGVVSGDITNQFAKLLHRMADELPRAAVLILNSFEGLNMELDLDLNSKFKSCLQIAPLHRLNPDQTELVDTFNCIQWLDRHGPATVAYISFGTSMNMPPSELAELAQGLEIAGVPFIWSLKDSEKKHLPIGFLDKTRDRSLVVAWAPQVKVLEHAAVGAFVTHCGWNSVIESIMSGVPLMCRPLLGDHMMIARSITHVWKVGVEFKGGIIHKGDVATALQTVMKEEEGRLMRERMGELKVKAIQAVQPDGSSVRNFKALVEIVTAGTY